MRKLMQRIDRFCARHPRFGIPNLMLFIVIGNAAVWLFSLMNTTTYSIYSFLYFIPSAVLRGEVWRLLSFAFIPNSSGIWVLIFLYFYFFIGRTLEGQWGTPKFTLYFICGMLFNIIYGFAVYFIAGIDVAVDASYIYLSMFFSFATLYPDQRVLLFFFIPVKIKWLAWLDAAFFLISVLTNPFPYSLLPLVAVLNYLLFCGAWLFDFLRPSRFRSRKRTVDFKKEAARINREQARRPYSRRCEVCGRTDADYPELEFRYCSRCQGYHCFCIDHINDHTHRTE